MKKKMMMQCVMKSWIDSNDNGLFKPNFFNRDEEEDWIHKPPWEPLNLISNPLWIDRVVEWGCANVISIPDYVKRGTLSTVHTWSKLSKRDYDGPWTAC